MLKLILKSAELFDEETSTIVDIPELRVRLEHNLLSVSKWEGKYKKPFLSSEKSNEEILDYINMMSLDDLDEDFSWRLTPKQLEKVQEYLNDAQTATVITNTKGGISRAIITSEVIYYWMTAFSIPFECETWPLNRLITLVRVCEAKSQDPKKTRMRLNEVYRQNEDLNAQRRKMSGSRG